jgi:hypothetical protein
MSACEEDIQFIDGHAGYLERAHVGITNLERAAVMSCADF